MSKQIQPWKTRIVLLFAALALAVHSIQLAFAQGTWTTVAPMLVKRTGHAAAQLNGKIYAIAGSTINTDPRHVEAYDPTTDTWSPVALIPTERSLLAAVTAACPAPDSNRSCIYAIGGADRFGALGTVEAYDAATDTWKEVAPMPTPRSLLAAATAACPAPDSNRSCIYAIGGRDINNATTDMVEAYDPATDTWSPVAPIPTPRDQMAAVTAPGPDGRDRIYAIGGQSAETNFSNTVEVYDPSLDKWCACASMPTGRRGLAAATGPDGRIYAIGGNSSVVFDTVEALTPLPGNTWTPVAAMLTPRSELAAVTATGPDGRSRIYAIGGRNADHIPLDTVEAYDPETDTWTPVAPMPTPRARLAAATGPDGKIYAIGGIDSVDRLVGTVEAYDPVTNTWTTVASVQFLCQEGMAPNRAGHASATGGDGRIYAIGGFCGFRFPSLADGTASVEAYDPSADTWTFVADIPHVGVGRYLLAAATGLDGRIYGVGGAVRDAVGTELIYNFVSTYDSSLDTWSSVAALPTPRFDLAAATGPDGKVYAIGGISPRPDDPTRTIVVSSVDAYDPTTDTWTPVDCIKASFGLAAATGPDGRIYAIGGSDPTGHVRDTVAAYAP